MIAHVIALIGFASLWIGHEEYEKTIAQKVAYMSPLAMVSPLQQLRFDVWPMAVTAIMPLTYACLRGALYGRCDNTRAPREKSSTAETHGSPAATNVSQDIHR